MVTLRDLNLSDSEDCDQDLPPIVCYVDSDRSERLRTVSEQKSRRL